MFTKQPGGSTQSMGAAFHPKHPTARIVIMNDGTPNLRVVKAVLNRAGYKSVQLIHPTQVQASFSSAQQPDVLIINGIGTLLELTTATTWGRDIRDSDVPIVVLTSAAEQDLRQELLHYGALDVTAHPLEQTELVQRVEAAAKLRTQYWQLTVRNNELERQTRERFAELAHVTSLVGQSREEALWLIGLTLEYRDYETKGHTERVTRLAVELGHKLGLDATQIRNLRWGAYLHDIGKIAISDRILLKEGPLTKEEYEHVKGHAATGERMVRHMSFLPDEVIQLVRHHHERWDGRGYPDGLAGKNIPYLARVFAVADVYDALASNRPYKDAWSYDDAMTELLNQQGKQFDPEVVQAFRCVNVANVLD